MIPVSGKASNTISKFILFFGALGAVFYPIFISPFMNPEKFKNLQRETRKNIRREDIQPGNMNIWSNPFAPRSEKDMQEKQ